jgi:hypothetical protein
MPHPAHLNEFVIQCSCDHERKIADPDCRACTDLDCSTCDRAALYESDHGGVCLRCFTQSQPSLAEIALMEATPRLRE